MNDDNSDRNLRVLIAAYLKCVDEAATAPAVSISSFVKFYRNLFLWYLNFCPLAITLFVRLLRKVFPRVPAVGEWSIQYFLRPLRSLSAGEIPLLRFLTLRSATTLLLARHIKSRVRTIQFFLGNNEIRALISGGDPDLLAKIAKRRTLLSKLNSNISTLTDFRLVLFGIPPLSLFISKVFDKHFRDSLSKSGISPSRLWTWSLAHPLWTMGLGFYGLWVFVFDTFGSKPGAARLRCGPLVHGVAFTPGSRARADFLLTLASARVSDAARRANASEVQIRLFRVDAVASHRGGVLRHVSDHRRGVFSLGERRDRHELHVAGGARCTCSKSWTGISRGCGLARRRSRPPTAPRRLLRRTLRVRASGICRCSWRWLNRLSCGRTERL